MTSPWTFGEEPLAQTVELAAVLRRITALAISMEHDDPRVAQLAATLAEAERTLTDAVPPSPLPRVGGNVDADGRVYLDHSRDIGSFNPCFPEYDVVVDGDSATGTVIFPIAYEGPPGLVHGGFLAVFFDSVIQHHNCDVGVAGKTTNLELRYRRPTPLLTPLRFEIDRVTEADRIVSTARLFDGERLCAEAVMRALAGDRANLPTGLTTAVAAVTSSTVDAGDDLPLTVGALLRQRATERGADPLLVCDDDTLTYADAAARSAALAGGLLAHGAGKGTHVGLLHPNGPDFVVAWLAAARIGAVTLPFSTFSTPTELAGLLGGSDTELLLAAAAYRNHRYPDTLAAAIPELDLKAPPPLLAPSVPTLRHIWFATERDLGPTGQSVEGWTLGSLLAESPSIGDDVLAAAEAEVTPADRMVIVHTSGSTSAPKGVIHTHGSLIRHLDNLNELRAFGPGQILFSNSPFFWIGGFAYALLGTLVAGGRLVCSNAATSSGVLDVIERERPTMVNGFAQSVAHLPNDPTFASRDLSSIRRGNLWPILPVDVAPADPELRHAMLGMTEAGSVCLLGDGEVDLPEHQRGSFGRPAPGFEARVLDPDTGRPSAVGEAGELWFRGPFLMEGYYGRTRAETFDAAGWFNTGDLVTVDGDGLFYFKGRRGDMIKTRGANVSPREVEAAIEDLAGLRSHVTGIDDDAAGQLVAVAVVVPTGGSLGDDGLDALRAGLAQKLSAYKVPKIFVALDEADVPMMSSGKLDARALKALLREH